MGARSSTQVPTTGGVLNDESVLKMSNRELPIDSRITGGKTDNLRNSFLYTVTLLGVLIFAFAVRMCLSDQIPRGQLFAHDVSVVANSRSLLIDVEGFLFFQLFHRVALTVIGNWIT